MANDIFFGRDTRVFLVQGATTWEIPVLNGYSFTQSTNTSEVTLSEMTDANGNSRRGRAVFNDSQSPTDWSFDTYVRPTINANKHTAVEEPLWANFVAKNTYAAGSWLANTVNAVAGTSLDIKFTNSNKTELGEFDLVFVAGAGSAKLKFDPDAAPVDPEDVDADTVYDAKIMRVYNAAINEVGLSFDIDGIATLNWSGNGAELRAQTTPFDASTAIRVGIDSTRNFIRNRLTQMTIVRTLPAGGTKTYNITLTGGSITMSNNLSYLTPELLGRVNTPLGHVTGTRTIGGSFTCYLDGTAGGSAELFDELSAATNEVRNQFDLTFYVGGSSGTIDTPRAPGIAISIPRAHLTVPALETGDVLSLNVDFSALPSNMNTPDEVDLVRYVGAA